VATPEERHRVEVEWHSASRSYVHRILEAHSGRVLTQLPAAQVLEVVADLMAQIKRT
jgi:uncharacterized FlaG/YvyC family protein